MNILIVLGASIISGLVGVVVTLIVQRRNSIRQQKVAVFQTLLANRHQLTADVNVQALNVIDIVFYRHERVRAGLTSFIEATNKKPVDGMLIVTKYLRLVEAVGEAVGMQKLDWDRINSCYYNPIVLAERTQENDLLRKAMLKNQLSLANQHVVQNSL